MSPGEGVLSLNYNGSVLFGWINSYQSVHACVREKLLILFAVLQQPQFQGLRKASLFFFVVVVVAGDTANTADQKYHCSS